MAPRSKRLVSPASGVLASPSSERFAAFGLLFPSMPSFSSVGANTTVELKGGRADSHSGAANKVAV